MGYIYKIVNNVNNKIYIGKTENVDPIKRFNEHKKDYKKRSNEKRPLYNAMKKYGIDNFSFEIIEETDNTSDREIYWINKLRTYIGFKDCVGYNATLGGDGKKYLTYSDDTIISYHINYGGYKINNTAKHFNIDRQTVKNICQRNNVPYLSMLEARRDNGKPNIYMIDPTSKKIFMIFSNLIDAKKYMHKNKSNGTINDVLNGRRKWQKAYGYYWCYESEYNDFLKCFI